MTRKPFNPDDIAGPKLDFGAARRDSSRIPKMTDAKPLTVSELSDLIRGTLEDRVPSPLRVVGEISNFNGRNHWYFSLKDESTVIGCVAWASTVRRFKFVPEDGQEVVATGHVSHYGPQGRTQFYASALEPVGAGALDLKYKALCETLRKLGYFEESRKRSLPLLPRRVAVVTSARSAAASDVRTTMEQRCRAVSLVFFDVRVQGEGASSGIASTIRRINRDRASLGVDAILVTRGGGSIEDLWAFNERIVADAVHESELPVVAAIGHESDTTIIELVADVRASTPTQAAVRLVPTHEELLQQVGYLAHRLVLLMGQRIERERDRLHSLARFEAFRRPRAMLERHRTQFEGFEGGLKRGWERRRTHALLRVERHARVLDTLRPDRVSSRLRTELAILEDRLTRATRYRFREAQVIDRMSGTLRNAVRRSLRNEHEHLRGHSRWLESIDVHSVLRRGFSYTTGAQGSIIKSIAQTRDGDEITTHLADGTVRSTVGGSRGRRRRSSVDGSNVDDQLDLFNRNG